MKKTDISHLFSELELSAAQNPHTTELVNYIYVLEVYVRVIKPGHKTHGYVETA